MSFDQVQAEHARLVLASFADAGVEDVVVSPGSRSTPFLLAALAEPRLHLQTVIDERCAAFFALGQARVTGRPSLLLCTSGTAGANYFPAIIEASMARVPLLVLTADRPLELVDCGANQTIDQIRLFGTHVRQFVDLGLADAHPAAFAGTRRSIAQAVTTSLWPSAGPVHLNARARKPLEPSGEAPDPQTRAEVDRCLARALPKPARPSLASEDLAALGRRLDTVERGLIVAGPAPVAPRHRHRLANAVEELARRTGWPLIADLASQLRSPTADGSAVVRCNALDTLFAEPEHRERFRPDLVL